MAAAMTRFLLLVALTWFWWKPMAIVFAWTLLRHCLGEHGYTWEN